MRPGAPGAFDAHLGRTHSPTADLTLLSRQPDGG
jgi:hypothetical protein